MKYSKKTYILILSSLVALVSVLYWFPSNPIPAEVRQRKEQIGKEYTRINLELLRIRKLKAETQTNLHAYDAQENIYEEQQKKLSEESAQIDAKYIGTPEAEASEAKARTWKESRVLNGVTYLPDDLFYTFPKTWRDSGLVYITQSQREHFLHNGMLATDIGTSGEALDLYAPDYNNLAVSYDYKRLDSHDTLGKTIKLSFPKEEYGDRYWLLGHVSEFYKETGATVTTGQPVGTVGGCEGSIKANKEKEEGASTGCHVHIELWKDGVRLPYPETVGIQHNFESVKPLQSVTHTNIKLTSYNPAKEQTDASPCIGATGVNLCDAVKATPGIQILALSQDLVSRKGKTPFHYGDRVRLTSTLQDARCNQEAIVLDTMNRRFTKRGDLFFMERKHNTSCTVTITKI
jgi:murein DD-endopeptidase MepM/ murein hydrolase activator NlpD